VKALLCFLCLGTLLGAEEVLSSKPIVIAPKRIETKTELPPEAKLPEKKAEKKSEKKPTAPVAVAEKIDIDAEKVVASIQFAKGSIRLTEAAQNKLRELKLKPGQKLRISGFGDSARKTAGKIANLRARVVASFLDEAVGGDGLAVKLQWRAAPHESFAQAGGVVEVVE